MTLKFKHALSANAVSSAVGMGIQAATPPIFLWVLHVEQFGLWILVTSIAAYISLALNGLLYAVMNEVVIAAHQNKRDEAARAYNVGVFFITTLWICFAVGTAVIGWVFRLDMNDVSFLTLIAILLNLANLMNIMFDANFRAMERYQYGTNLLTCLRVMDWLVAVLLIVSTHDVPRTIVGLLLYKIAVSLLAVVVMQRHHAAISIRPLAALDSALWMKLSASARNQFLLSLWVAASAMGPQIVMSVVFNSMLAVMFNTYRTYYRLVSAVVTVLTSASWPILSQMYAAGRVSDLHKFISRLLPASMIGATLFGLLLLAAAEPVFAILFHSKVPVEFGLMIIILVSVIVNCGITVQQSLFLSTNISSQSIAWGLLATVVGLLLMAVCGTIGSLELAISAQLFVDICVFVAMYINIRKLLSQVTCRRS